MMPNVHEFRIIIKYRRTSVAHSITSPERRMRYAYPLCIFFLISKILRYDFPFMVRQKLSPRTENHYITLALPVHLKSFCRNANGQRLKNPANSGYVRTNLPYTCSLLPNHIYIYTYTSREEFGNIFMLTIVWLCRSHSYYPLYLI